MSNPRNKEIVMIKKQNPIGSVMDAPPKNSAFRHILLSDVVARNSYYEAWNEINPTPQEPKCILIAKFPGIQKSERSDAELEAELSGLIVRKAKNAAFQPVGVALNGSFVLLASYSMIDQLIEILSEYCEQNHLDYRIGISSPINNVDYFSVVYSEAIDAVASSTESSKINSYQKNQLRANAMPGGTADLFCQDVSRQLIESLAESDDARLPTIIPGFIKHISTMDYNTAFNICIDIIRSISEHFGLDTYEDFHIKYRFDLFGQEEKIFSAIRTTFVDNLFRIIAILKEAPENSTKRIIKKVRYLVERNYSNPNLSLLDIAGTLNLSYNYLSSIVKQTTGTSFVNHLTTVRMNNAVKMLMQGSYKVSEIATAVGFNSSGYFVTVFKRYFKSSPSEYRARALLPVSDADNAE